MLVAFEILQSIVRHNIKTALHVVLPIGCAIWSLNIILPCNTAWRHHRQHLLVAIILPQHLKSFKALCGTPKQSGICYCYLFCWLSYTVLRIGSFNTWTRIETIVQHNNKTALHGMLPVGCAVTCRRVKGMYACTRIATWRHSVQHFPALTRQS